MTGHTFLAATAGALAGVAALVGCAILQPAKPATTRPLVFLVTDWRAGPPDVRVEDYNLTAEDCAARMARYAAEYPAGLSTSCELDFGQ